MPYGEREGIEVVFVKEGGLDLRYPPVGRLHIIGLEEWRD